MAQIRDVDIDVNISGPSLRLAALNAAVALATTHATPRTSSYVVGIASAFERYLRGADR